MQRSNGQTVKRSNGQTVKRSNGQTVKRSKCKLKPHTLKYAFISIAIGFPTYGFTNEAIKDTNPLIKEEFVPGELILRYEPKSGITPEDIIDSVSRIPAVRAFDDRIINELNFPIGAHFTLSSRLTEREIKLANPDSPLIRLNQYITIKYPETIDLNAQLEKLKQNPNIAWVGKNRLFQTSSSGPDPLIGQQWHLNSSNLNLINAWDLSKGHAYLAMMDVGIEIQTSTNTAHEDLEDPDALGNFRAQFSYDFGADDNDVTEDSIGGAFGHGTHVAGIMAAVTDNSTGVAGNCPNCSLIVTKTNSILFSSEERLVNSINWMVKVGSQAINYSGGYRSWSTDYFECPQSGQSSSHGLYCDALALVVQSDVVYVAAAGNDERPINDNAVTGVKSGEPLDFPAVDPRTIAVGSTANQNDPHHRADFSAFGPQLDLVAPGVDIISTFYTNADWAASGNKGVRSCFLH